MNEKQVHSTPVACYLDGQSYRERVARIGVLKNKALLSRERLGLSVRLSFRLDFEVLAELEELVEECCPFLVLALEHSSTETVLLISGPEESASLLDDAFGP
jgi:hypothetical protein